MSPESRTVTDLDRTLHTNLFLSPDNGNPWNLNFKFQLFPSLQDRKTNLSNGFLGEVMAQQFCFGIYWSLAQTISIRLNLKKSPNFNQWLSAIWRRRVMLSLWKEFFLAVPSQKSHPSLQLIRDRRQSAASLDCVGGKIQKCLWHIYVLKIRPLLITYGFESFFERCLWNITEVDQIKCFSETHYGQWMLWDPIKKGYSISATD